MKDLELIQRARISTLLSVEKSDGELPRGAPDGSRAAPLPKRPISWGIDLFVILQSAPGGEPFNDQLPRAVHVFAYFAFSLG
jgi:hypothetical protein